MKCVILHKTPTLSSPLFSILQGWALLSIQRAIMLWFVTLGRQRQTVNQGQATGCLHSLPNYSFLLGMQCPKVEFIAWWWTRSTDPPPAQIPPLALWLPRNQNKNNMILHTPPARVLSKRLVCDCLYEVVSMLSHLNKRLFIYYRFWWQTSPGILTVAWTKKKIKFKRFSNE